MKKRVVITGYGCITPIGLNPQDFWRGLIEGKSGIGPITLFDTKEFPTTIGAEIKGFEPEKYISRKEVRRVDPYTQYAIASAKQAVEHAQLSITEEIAERVGVIVGSGSGGMNMVKEGYQTLSEKGPKRISSYLSSGMLINSAAGEISIIFGAKGPSSAVVTACATASSCIGEGMRMIQYGTADVMIVGGAEGDCTPLDLGSFSKIRALSRRNDEPTKASRPFDKDRDGFVLGAGAGVLVIEEAEFAMKRGATILAELVGYGATTDAYHITAPDPEASQQARAIRMAIEESGMTPDEIDYVNAHGTSTQLNDQLETTAIKKALGERAYEIPVSSIKSSIGHLLGGAGAVELIATICAIQEQKVPPTLNLDEPEEGLDLNYVPYQPLEVPVRAAISNSFGFGGHNVCLAVRKWEE
ncbi:beta-ketoacyl-ACP synthase II [Hazenella coriacea]|uniref:3-oxoacyl-[acyl-carrier-protein] synthase 2 n=1 Tax=Hazenella coriacea TaxID=1179467 RepID=A0A4R3KZZ5_9BACL|nr:beta-ketoacyl-ACP synthase II [Hazenella coriacea]TCS92393.1 3-oxoacyl-[acyl-carrier-protein] synthase II [Hazenella coriacea]